MSIWQTLFICRPFWSEYRLTFAVLVRFRSFEMSRENQMDEIWLLVADWSMISTLADLQCVWWQRAELFKHRHCLIHTSNLSKQYPGVFKDLCVCVCENEWLHSCVWSVLSPAAFANTSQAWSVVYAAAAFTPASTEICSDERTGIRFIRKYSLECFWFMWSNWRFLRRIAFFKNVTNFGKMTVYYI